MSAQMVPSVVTLLENKDLNPWLSDTLLPEGDDYNSLTMYSTNYSLSLDEMSPSINMLNSFNQNMQWTENYGNKKIHVANLDGVNSQSVVTVTNTTDTLTPTTLKQINESFGMQDLEFEEHEKQGRFVPPPITPFATVSQGTNGSISIADLGISWHGGLVTSETSITPSPQPSLHGSTLTSCPTPRSSTPGSRCDTPPQTQPTRRNVGGRRPINEKGISPEEEQRRQVRRERNKLAAARCRKRRMDHTNELLKETEALEDKKNGIQVQIQELQAQKDELEMILAAHTPCCRLNLSQSPSPNSFLNQDKVTFQAVDKSNLNDVTVRIKQEPDSIPISEPSTMNPNKRIAVANSNRPRPTSLPVSSSPYMSTTPLLTDLANIPSISTPSNGIPLNFESLMNGGTGLTPQGPLAPSCSSQQRDLPTPENGNNKRMLSL